MEGPKTGAKVFSKELTLTDLDHRLHWPAEWLPTLPDFKGGHQMDFVVKDVYGRRWEMRCSKCMTGPYQKPVISSGWLPFLHGKRGKLTPANEVIFYRSPDGDAHFAVRFRRKVLLFGANIDDLEE